MRGQRDGRRVFLSTAAAGALLVACGKRGQAGAADPGPSGAPEAQKADGTSAAPPRRGQHQEEDVGAVEDLMREHGVIRRLLVVYRESATRLQANAASVPHEALLDAARLMRTFGEDYHERQLEEAHIFPAVRRAGGPAAGEIDVLVAQHARGREITDYMLDVTSRPIGKAVAGPLAGSMDAFARMYEEHAAREDTIVFVAWKKTMTPKQLDEMGDLFEDIEKKTFGRDGFDHAVAKVGAIEKQIGLDSAALTAPPPPGL